MPVPGITVAKIGGHFEGAAVLHWPAGADGQGALLTGDTVTVVYDRRWLSFMWSYPNQIPLDGTTIRRIVERVTRFPFTRIYGGWWGRNVLRRRPCSRAPLSKALPGAHFRAATPRAEELTG